MNKLENLTFRIRTMLDTASSELLKMRNDLAGGTDFEVESKLSWRAEDMMRLSAEQGLLMTAAAILGNALMSKLAEMEVTELSDISEGEIVLHVRALVASECMRTILRGAESSTSRGHNMASLARIEAAKYVLEKVAGLDSHRWGTELFIDMFNGIDARDAASRAEFEAKPAKVTVSKADGKYTLLVLDNAGRTIDSERGFTRKEEAKVAAQTLASVHSLSHSKVEFV